MKNTLKTTIVAGMVSLMTLGMAFAQDDIQSNAQPEVNAKPDYVCMPMPMYQMMTSDENDSTKPQAPEFFICGQDGKLTQATTNLGDLMKTKDASFGEGGDKSSGEMMPPQPETKNKFVLMTYDEFAGLVNQKVNKMDGKGSDRMGKMVEKIQSGKNTVDATVGGKNVKVFIIKPNKHGQKGNRDKSQDPKDDGNNNN